MQPRTPLAASLTEPFEPHPEPTPNRHKVAHTTQQQQMPQLLERMKSEVQRGAEDAFFVVDLNSVVDRLRLWKTLLPDVTPYYAVKCNPDAMLLSTLAVHGVNFDCASRAEIQSVLDLGVSPDRIIYANPCKQPSHLRFAADRGVGLSVADSESELLKMAATHPAGELLLRIAVDDSQAQCVMSCKYGAPVDAVPALLRTAAEVGLRVRGVSFHVGSGCYSADAFAQAVERAGQVFDVAERCGVPMDVLDIGGGFPGRDTDSLSFADIAAALRPALAEHFPSERGVGLIAEPGRFFVAQSHALAVNIIGKKSAPAGAEDAAPHTMYFVNDGLYGSFNCVLYDHAQPQPHVLPAEGRAAQPPAAASVWGPTCDGLDCIAAEASLPELRVGDWLYFEDMGAYTAAAGSTFNGMPLPEKVYVPLQCALDVA